jgi:hypothetical protein
MPFTAEGNVMLAESFAPAPTTHVVVRSCREFETRCPRPCMFEVTGSNVGGIID